MSSAITLLRHSLRRGRVFLIAGALFLAVFQLFVIVAARSLFQSGGFQQLGALVPSFFERWTNMAIVSFKGMVLFGYSHPLVELFLIAVAISVATEPVGEIETKFVDLLMARPVSRTAPVVRSVALLLVVAAGAVGSMAVAQWIGLRLLAPHSAEAPGLRVSLDLVINLLALILAWGGIALAIGSFAKRRATAAAICGFVAFAAFVLDYVGRFWQTVAPAARLSPFHYYNPFPLIGGAALPGADIGVLLAVFIAGSIAAAAAYARRDL